MKGKPTNENLRGLVKLLRFYEILKKKCVLSLRVDELFILCVYGRQNAIILLRKATIGTQTNKGVRQTMQTHNGL